MPLSSLAETENQRVARIWEARVKVRLAMWRARKSPVQGQKAGRPNRS
jgi:hypothetical protein